MFKTLFTLVHGAAAAAEGVGPANAGPPVMEIDRAK
jgi:hypothetical protein